MACLKHSDFLKVKGSAFTPHSQVQLQSLSICQNKTRCSPRGRTGLLQQKSNYELFNRNNFNIRYWSWNYRGCWHQTCPPIDTCQSICTQVIPITKHWSLVLVFLFNYPSEFLFIHPSQYICTIGLKHVPSVQWHVPLNWHSTSKECDSGATP